MKFLALGFCVLSSLVAGATLEITNFGAKGDGLFRLPAPFSAPIDACPAEGTVVIPAGKFVTGALFLKSDLTLQLAAGAVLKGSIDPKDYEPEIRNRFEGWEMDTYASASSMRGSSTTAGRSTFTTSPFAAPARLAGVASRSPGP